MLCCRDDSLRTALHWAAAHGLADIAQQLLSNAEAQMTSMQTSAASGDLDQVHVPPPLRELEVRQPHPASMLMKSSRHQCSPRCICHDTLELEVDDTQRCMKSSSTQSHADRYRCTVSATTGACSFTQLQQLQKRLLPRLVHRMHASCWAGLSKTVTGPFCNVY